MYSLTSFHCHITEKLTMNGMKNPIVIIEENICVVAHPPTLTSLPMLHLKAADQHSASSLHSFRGDLKDVAQHNFLFYLSRGANLSAKQMNPTVSIHI